MPILCTLIIRIEQYETKRSQKIVIIDKGKGRKRYEHTRRKQIK